MQYIFKALFAVTLFFTLVSCGNQEDHLDKKGGPSLISVDVFVTTPSPFQLKHKATGSLMAYESVNLTTESSGKIKTIRFKEGSRVVKGTLLVELQNDDLKAQVEKADLQQKMLKTELGRKDELLKIDGISQEEYDQAENAYLTAVANYHLDLANLNKTRIYAPFTGLVGLRQVSEGDFITSNTPVATLQQVDQLKLEFDLPEEFAHQLKINTPVTFSVATSDSLYKANIYAIEPMVDRSTRTIKARALVKNTDRLVPGQFADIVVGFETIPDALLIPSQAIIQELQGQRVWLKKGGKVTPVSVKTSEYTSSSVLVSKGLQPGDTVITSGLLQVKPGMPVGVKSVENSNQK